MARALKIIDGIILALFIICGAALIIPQLIGINTVVVQQEMTGNVAVGTAVYAEKTESASMQEGDRILNLGSTSVDIYTVETYDADNKIVTVNDGEHSEYNVSEYYLKVVRTVPLIGYLMIATQSTVGVGILAALLIYVILAFIFAEIFKRSEDEDEDDDSDEDDEDYYRSLAARKKKSAPTASASADAASDNAAGRDNVQAAQKFPNTSAEEFATQLLKEGMAELSQEEDSEGEAPETADKDETEADSSIGVDSLPDVQAALEAALENQPLNRPENTGRAAVLEPVSEDVTVDENGEIELAMPVRTADELLQKAYAEGLDPNVREDLVTGVTLVDFSDSL